MAFRCFVWISS